MKVIFLQSTMISFCRELNFLFSQLGTCMESNLYEKAESLGFMILDKKVWILTSSVLCSDREILASA